MPYERIKYLGRLESRRLEEKELRTKLDGLRDSIRDHLDLFEAHENIKADVVAAQGIDYAAAQSKLQEVLGEIRAIEKLMNES